MLFSFLCSVFIVSQASTTMAMTTSTPVTVLCSSTSSLLSTVTMAPSLIRPPVTTGQHDVLLPPPPTPRHSGGVIGLAPVPQQQPLSQMLLQAYTNYAMGPTEVGVTFRVEPPIILFYLYVWCLLLCMLSCAMLDAVFTYGGSTIGFTPLQPFTAYPWQAYVQPCDGHWLTTCMYRVAAPSIALSRRKPPTTQSAVLHPFQTYGGAYSFGSSAESHPVPPPSLHNGRGLFQVWFHLMTQLTLNLQ